MSGDKYKNFEELNKSEERERDFDIEKKIRDSELAVIAIHGGRIEFGTDEIARQIAGDKLSFYAFLGKKPIKNSTLHISSNNFDELECLELVKKCESVISIHGEKTKDEEFIMIGGLDKKLGEKIGRIIAGSGFFLKEPPENLKGENPANVCNLGTSGAGVQLELSKKLRDELLSNEKLMGKFTSLIKQAMAK